MSLKKTLLRLPAIQSLAFWKTYFHDACAYRIMPEKALQKRFIRKCHYTPNLAAPSTYNEKLQWLKLHWTDDLARKCADKVSVREYVAKQGYVDTLIPLLGIYTKVSQIPFSSLPQKFVLKGAHGSGFVCICNDKAHFDQKNALAQMRRWLRVDYANYSAEWVYRKMPRRIVCEEYLETENGLPPVDYKIYCFHGVPKCVMVASGRTEGRLCMDFFTPEWERLPFTRHNPNSVVPPQKPENLTEMLAMAQKLSQPFAHVRIDLYSVQKQIRFGEMTFFPATGMQPFDPFSYDMLFGSWLDLEKVRVSNV